MAKPSTELVNAVSVAYRQSVEAFQHLNKKELEELWNKWIASAIWEF